MRPRQRRRLATPLHPASHRRATASSVSLYSWPNESRSPSPHPYSHPLRRTLTRTRTERRTAAAPERRKTAAELRKTLKRSRGNGSGPLSDMKSSAPSCQESCDSSDMEQEFMFMLSKLPEDIFDHLYSLVPMQDAARAACVSRGFLRSWRRYPRLVFNSKTLGLEKLLLCLDEDALALNDKQYREDKIERHFANVIGHILKNHSGFGIKALILQLYRCRNIDASHIDEWLQIAVKPGIKELTFEVPKRAEYNFPFLLLSDDIGGATLQFLRLSFCAFHPIAALGCNKSLTSLHLYLVHISDEELGQFVSNCLALVRLSIFSCNDIVCFKVPCAMLQLNYLLVRECEMLQVIEICAPKLSSFVYGENLVHISLGADVKHISIVGYSKPNMIYQARTELPSFMPAVERLTVTSQGENVKLKMMPSKFLHLNCLEISLLDLLFYRYDYLYLVSFLEASPTLETFVLRVEPCLNLRRDSILGALNKGQLHLRRMPVCRHDNLKNVMITGFSSAKSLIELTIHIAENASVLSCMMLDTARGCCRNTKAERCLGMTKDGLLEAQKAVEAVRRCIEGIVPSSVNFKMLEPCSQCGCSG